ncbi:MAG: hypothetical protein WC481_05350 [Candidatus Omnitrophota bacterium]
MKKPFIAVTVIFIAIAATAAGIYVGYIAKPQAIESALPAGPVFFVKLFDADRQFEEFRSSRLYKNVEAIDIGMLLEKSGAKKEQAQAVGVWKADISGFIDGLPFEKYFGKEIAVAVYPSGVLFAAKVKPESKIADLFAIMFKKPGKIFEEKEEDCSGRKISVVKIGDRTSVFMVRIKDVMVAGTDKMVVMSCYDAAGRKIPALAQDKDFIGAVSGLEKGAEMAAFGDIGRIAEGLKNAVTAIPEPAGKGISADILKAFKENMGLRLGEYGGFGTFFYARYPGEIKKSVMTVKIDRSKMIPFLRESYSVAPRGNNTLKFIPPNAIWYGWDTVAWRAYWQYLKEAMIKGTPEGVESHGFDDIVAEFESWVDFSIENDLIPALGDEGALCLIDVNYDGLIPSPQFIYIVKVNDKQAIDLVLGKFFRSDIEGEEAVKTETYNNVEIKYLDLPFGLAFQPAYCYVGDNLLLSLGRMPLKNSIDSCSGSAKSLLDSEDFRLVSSNPDKPANQVRFVDTDALLREARDFCDWGLRWLTYISEENKAYYEKQKKYEEMILLQMDRLRAGIKELEKELADMKAQRADPAVLAEVKSELDLKIWDKNSMLKIDKEQLAHLEEQEKHRVAVTRQDMDVPLIRLWVEKAAYPIMEGLSSNNVSSSKTVFTENVICTETFFK